MSAEVKYCEYCGTALSVEARFCRRCGRQMPDLPAEEAPIVVSVVDADEVEAPVRLVAEEKPMAEAPPPPRRGATEPPAALTVVLAEPPPPPKREPPPVPPAALHFSPLAVLKALLLSMFNPRRVLVNLLGEVTTPVALIISGLAFLLFFLQTGLDMLRVGNAQLGQVIGLSFMGLGYGIIGVAALAALAWLICRPLGNPHPLGWTVGAFGISFSPALVYLVIGLLFNLFFGWNTALVFGVTGVLWALPCLVAAIQEMLPNRLVIVIALATVCGGILLYGWTWLGAAL